MINVSITLKSKSGDVLASWEQWIKDGPSWIRLIRAVGIIIKENLA